MLPDYKTDRREDLCKRVESRCYLERTRHIRTFISEINQPSNYQSNKKPPGKAEEIQEAVEIPGE